MELTGGTSKKNYSTYSKKSNHLSYNERRRKAEKLKREDIKNREAHGIELSLIQKVKKFFKLIK